MRTFSNAPFGAAANVVVAVLLVIVIYFSSPIACEWRWPSRMCVSGSRLAHARFGFDFGALPVHRYAAASLLANAQIYIVHTHEVV